MKLSLTPVRLSSFWPLLVVIVALVWLVWWISPTSVSPDATRWANLRIVPFKVLMLCVAMYLSHRYDERAFAGLAKRIDDALRMLKLSHAAQTSANVVTGETRNDPAIAVSLSLVALGATAIARAIVYGATVIALCTGG